MSIPFASDRAIVRMLSHLDRKQRKGFHDYLNCDLFNTNPTLASLYACIEKHLVAKKKAGFSDTDLLEGSGIKPGLLDKLCSQLMGHLNRFVPLWAQRNDPRPGFGEAFSAWVNMGLPPELLEREHRKMQRKLKNLPPTEFSQVYALQLEHAYAQYQASRPRRDQANAFDQLSELLDQFYITAKLKYRCAQISAGRIFHGDAPGQEEEIRVADPDIQQLPALARAYYRVYRLLNSTQPSREQVATLMAQMQTEGLQFSRLDRVDLYGYLLNSCIPHLLSSIPAFAQIVLNIYRAMLTQELLPVGAYFPGSHYKNIVSIMVQEGEVAEARAFHTKYHKSLKTREQVILVPYIEGLLYFHETNFRAAIARFRQIIQNSPEDLFWGLEARNMLWKSYYESFETLSMEEHAEMLKLYDSFRLFLARNNHISVEEKVAYDNFIRIFNRLIKVSDRELWASTVAELQALRAQTAEIAPIVHKEWLLGAIDRRILKT